MNKYFLSLMSILILFQSFKVADEIFNHKKDQKKGYIILEQDDEEEVVVSEGKIETKEEKVDYDSLFTQANLESGFLLDLSCRLQCPSVHLKSDRWLAPRCRRVGENWLF